MRKFVPFTSINLEFPPNYILGISLLACYLLLTVVIFQLSVTRFWHVLILLSISVYGSYLYQYCVIRGRNSCWCAGQTLSNRQWVLQNRRGQYFTAHLRADTFVSSWLIVLRWDILMPTMTTRTASIPLFRAMLPSTLWRRLCCHLRWC